MCESKGYPGALNDLDGVGSGDEPHCAFGGLVLCFTKHWASVVVPDVAP